MQKLLTKLGETLTNLILAFIILFVSILLYIRYLWPYAGFEQIIITGETLTIDIIKKYLTSEDYIKGLFIFIIAYPLCYIYLNTRRQLYVILGLSLFSLWYSGFIEYQIVSRQHSSLYEEEYVFPDKITYTFPEKKRNLILIYLESFEDNLQHAENYEKNLIPNLQTLQQQGQTSHQYYSVHGTDYSIAALVSSLCGVPLRYRQENDIFSRRYMLPQAICLPEILQNNGYQTTIFKAADITFTDVNVFASSHGFDKAAGFDELKQNIPADELKHHLGAFGGLKDSTLFELAKKQLENFSTERPFMLTLFTLDTHTPNYFKAPECPQLFGDIRDAYMCTDKNVSDFITWLKQSPYWENTSVVIVGDHLLPTHIKTKGHPRRGIYNTFLNLPENLEINTNKPFTTVDLAPSILEALGIRLSPRAFGLGRSLFSKEPTLVEKQNFRTFNLNLIKKSPIYDKFNQLLWAQVDSYPTYTPGTILKHEDFPAYSTAYEQILTSYYLDRLSFSFPTRPANGVKIDIKLNALIRYGKELKIYANNHKVFTFAPERHQVSPYTLSFTIPADIFTDNRLQLKLKNTSGNRLATHMGVNPLEMTITEIEKGQ